MEWMPIDENTPRKKTILLFGETGEIEPGVMNWNIATGYFYPYGEDEEDWYWDGLKLKSWDHKPTHWQPLPEPPSKAKGGIDD